MSVEIGSSRPLPPPGSRVPAAPATELALKLLQPLQGLLSEGQQAQAEVIALRQQQQSFQVLLRLTLSGGRQTTVPASSNQPLPEGTRLTLTALDPQRISATLQAGLETALTRLDTRQVPAGTLLQARVISSTAQPQSTGAPLYKVLAQLIASPLAGQTLQLDSPQPWPAGSLLSARVIGAQQLQVLTPSSQLNELEVQQQLGQQHARQRPLEALLKPLAQLQSRPELPPELSKRIGQLLAQVPEASQLQDAKKLAQTLTGSGSFFEARLLGTPAQGSPPPDFKGALLRLIAQLLPPLHPGAAPGAPGLTQAAFSNPALPALLRGLLSEGGPARPSQSHFPLPGASAAAGEPEADLETLLKLAAAAIARLQSHQLSSLAQSQTQADGTQLTTWQLEVPLRHQQEFTSLQLRFEREQPPPDKKTGQPGDTLWRVELAFDLGSLGPLQVQAQLLRGCFSSQLWAERADTAQLASAELPWLRERLNAAGLGVGELSCQQGSPPRGARTELHQRWIDEKA